MACNYYLHNFELRPIDEATVPLSSIEYAYGFGVYETLRAVGGQALFLDDHVARLLESARILNLEHNFDAQKIAEGITKLIEAAGMERYNLKLLLVGGPTPEAATLYGVCLNPLFPEKKLYQEGAAVITARYERPYPHAKSLNMLQSYLAYREAKRDGAYDALLVNRDGNVTEGTRTNFFCITGKTIYTPPEAEILLGVTRKNLLDVARAHGYTVEERDISLDSVGSYEGAFISSTSSKVIPLREIDGQALPFKPEALSQLMTHFDEFLRTQTPTN